jgi:peptidoglycan/LPS O-acetylase OafA/YrhL
MRPTRSKGHLPTLDLWRAIAILGVLADHVLGRLFQVTKKLDYVGEVTSSEQG